MTLFNRIRLHNCTQSNHLFTITCNKCVITQLYANTMYIICKIIYLNFLYSRLSAIFSLLTYKYMFSFCIF